MPSHGVKVGCFGSQVAEVVRAFQVLGSRMSALAAANDFPIYCHIIDIYIYPFSAADCLKSRKSADRKLRRPKLTSNMAARSAFDPLTAEDFEDEEGVEMEMMALVVIDEFPIEVSDRLVTLLQEKCSSTD